MGFKIDFTERRDSTENGKEEKKRFNPGCDVSGQQDAC